MDRLGDEHKKPAIQQNAVSRRRGHSLKSPTIQQSPHHRHDHEIPAIRWPALDYLREAADNPATRQRHIGGSDANIILSGDATRIRTLWQEKRGEAEPLDLSNNLPVMLGCWTEAFNRQWYEKLTGKVIIETGKQFVCRDHDWRRCTVDGLDGKSGAVFEAKHTSAFAKTDEVVERYMPQLQHNMAVVGVDHAILSVLFGNHKFEIIEVAADWLYQIELLTAEKHFWNCVLTGEEPVAVEPPLPPRPIGAREICLEGNNSWAAAAFNWLKHRDAAKLHSTACSLIKSLVDPGVSRVFGHGIEARRSRSGAITIKEFGQ